jgi:hypothetical protein
VESSLTEKDLYSLPFYQEAKPKWWFHILFCFLIIIFIGFVLIPGKDQEKTILNVVFLLFAVLFGYAWLATGFFNKPYLKITDEYLEYKMLFGRKVISLKSIYQVEFFSTRVNQFGIRTTSEQGKRSIWNAVDRFFSGGYSVTIPLSTFSTIDFDKLAVTIIAKAKANNSVL